MNDSLYEQVKGQLPDLLRHVVGKERADAVMEWLDATHYVRGQGAEGTSGRVSVERELVSRALEQWLKEAGGAADAGSYGQIDSLAATRRCQDCGASIDHAWWDSRRCDECWGSIKRATGRANKQRQRSRRSAA